MPGDSAVGRPGGGHSHDDDPNRLQQRPEAPRRARPQGWQGFLGQDLRGCRPRRLRAVPGVCPVRVGKPGTSPKADRRRNSMFSAAFGRTGTESAALDRLRPGKGLPRRAPAGLPTRPDGSRLSVRGTVRAARQASRADRTDAWHNRFVGWSPRFNGSGPMRARTHRPPGGAVPLRVPHGRRAVTGRRYVLSRRGRAGPADVRSKRGTSPATRLDPWCLLASGASGRKLFGFACDPAGPDGLAWMCSKELLRMQPDGTGAMTWSGTPYVLGRRFAFEDLAAEGEEAVLSLHLLDAASFVGDGSAVDRLWVSSCRIARHLGVPAPIRERTAVTGFMNRHLVPFSNRPSGSFLGYGLEGARRWKPEPLRKTG